LTFGSLDFFLTPTFTFIGNKKVDDAIDEIGRVYFSRHVSPSYLLLNLKNDNQKEGFLFTIALDMFADSSPSNTRQSSWSGMRNDFFKFLWNVHKRKRKAVKGVDGGFGNLIKIKFVLDIRELKNVFRHLIVERAHDGMHQH
jgi:hypothetical protein